MSQKDDPRRFLPLSPHQFHILLALVDDDRHGYGIILDVARRTGGALKMGTGTLYTAVARLLALDLLTESGREHERRRYYRLTSTGRAVLNAEAARLEALVRFARDKGIKTRLADRSSIRPAHYASRPRS